MAKNTLKLFSELIPFKFDTTLLVTTITSFAYACTYNYEATYCTVFNIPKEYISIDLISLIPFWTSTLFILFAVALLFYQYADAGENAQKKLNPVVINTYFIIALSIINYQNPTSLLFSIVTSFIILLIINWVYFKFKKKSRC